MATPPRRCHYTGTAAQRRREIAETISNAEPAEYAERSFKKPGRLRGLRALRVEIRLGLLRSLGARDAEATRDRGDDSNAEPAEHAERCNRGYLQLGRRTA